MTGKMIGIIVILSLILLILLIIIISVLRVKNKMNRFLQDNFQVDNLSEALRQTKIEASRQQRTVTDVSSIKVPQIVKDFPEFNVSEMQNKAENVLKSYLVAVDERNVARLTEGNSELKNELRNHIYINDQRGRKEHFKDIKIHRTALSNYVKEKGRCTITFQSAVQYIHTFEDELSHKTVEGDPDLYAQDKYETDLIYIQDREIAENDLDGAIALNCPNCGAPLSRLGAKVCEYCGTPVIEINIKEWSFSAVRKIG